MGNNFDIEKEISCNFKKHKSHIRACCAKFLRKEEEISLLESEVLEKVWVKKHLFSGTEAEFKAWVFTITRNSFISKYNQQKKYRTDDIDVVFEQPHTTFDIADDMDNKNKLVDIFYTIEKKFKKDHVDIFKANVVDGKQYNECAEEFGYPLSTVKNVIHTIRQYISDPFNIISEPKELLLYTIKQRPALIRPRTRFINSIYKIITKYNAGLAAIR